MLVWRYLLCLSLLCWFAARANVANAQANNSTGDRPAYETSVTAASAATLASSEADSSAGSEFTVFPIGLNLGDRNVLPSTLVKGIEAAEGDITFEQWLLPFDDVVQVLNITITTLETGELELRSPGLVTRIHSDAVQIDEDLGRVLSIEQIQTLLGVPASFERLDYAVRLDPPWAGQQRARRSGQEQPVVTEGLPAIEPHLFSLTGISQKTTFSGQSGRDLQSRGSFSAFGTIFGGSWYARTNQSELTISNSWRLGEFQYLRQTGVTDIVLGSQPTFWRSQGQGNDYWGSTYVQRWGFEPSESIGSGGFSPRQRLQAAAVGRTITGEADPGTLVQLTQELSNVVIDEVLVDSSGVYRFENVMLGNRSGGRYQVFLYPNGRLTAAPEIRAANFSTLPGQIPPGASALIVSGGFNRTENNNFLGTLERFRGGAALRQGLSEDLTLGAGVVQDQTTHALTELFYAPNNFPLELAVSALTDLSTAEIDVTADAVLRPSDDVSISFSGDQLSQRFNAQWQVSPTFMLLTRGNTRDNTISAGTRFSFSNRTFTFAGGATLDTKNRLRWNLSSRYGSLGLSHSGNEITTQSELAYNLSGSSANGTVHKLIMDYETRLVNGVNNQLGILSWNYRSGQRTVDGRPLWNLETGYGIGSQGSGIIASAATAILPGVEVRVRYQGVSAVSDQDTFQIELLPRLNLQGGIGSANRYQDNLRTQGGLMIQPFFDENNNGSLDAGETIYTEDLDLLVSIDHKSLNTYRPQPQGRGTTINLSPGNYRLDLDPAGYPLDWKADGSAFSITVVPGQYTPVLIPLTRAYSLIGVILDIDGNAASGQRLQAIHTESGEQQISVTNAAGVFFLEGLQQGEYTFSVGEEIVDNLTREFGPDSEPFQELNIRILPEGIEAQVEN